MRVLSLTNDMVFKEFLERELVLLCSMIGAVLGEEVADLTLINNELHGELAHDKTIVIDVRVVLRSGRRVIIEMQVLVDACELKPRLVFYAARDFVNQARRGRHYGSLTPTVTILWVVKPCFPELRQLHSVFELRERTTERSPHATRPATLRNLGHNRRRRLSHGAHVTLVGTLSQRPHRRRTPRPRTRRPDHGHGNRNPGTHFR